jgi:hypothetical protein
MQTAWISQIFPRAPRAPRGSIVFLNSANLARKCRVISTSVVLTDHYKGSNMKRQALALERLQEPRLLDAQPYPLRL